MSADPAARVLDVDDGLLDLLPDAVLGWDLDRRIVHWNRAAVELYGFGRADALGRRPADLFSTRFPAPLKSGFAGAVPGQATQLQAGDLLGKPFTAPALLERVAALARAR
jgi:PAS domain-containing protein